MTYRLDEVTLAATTEYLLASAGNYMVHLGEHATLEFWDGAAWVAYPSATGAETQDKAFRFSSPVSGRVRVVIAAAQTAVVSLCEGPN